MKTKLLLLFTLLIGSFVFSQTSFTNPTATAITNTTATVSCILNNPCGGGTFNMQYSTNDAYYPATTSNAIAQAPAGLKSFNITGLAQGTTYYFRFSTPANGCGSAQYSVNGTFTTIGVTPVSISSVSHTVTATSATISYSINSNYGNAISGIQYGLTPSYGTIKTGTNASGNSIVPGSFTIPGLTPNTTYYYQVYGNNQAGNSFSAPFSFTTSAAPPSIAEYNFNNSTYNNSNATNPFLSNSGTSFVTDRDDVTPNGALYINNTGTTAPIASLPSGNSPRSVSIWIKPNTIAYFNYLFGYGTQTNNNAYGFSFNASGINNFGWANDVTDATAIVANVWTHIVTTYDEVGMARIYINGVLKKSASKTNWNTAIDANFNLGRLVSINGSPAYTGAIDDLKIYPYALPQADITSLFTNNTLSNSDFSINNLEVALYPNPVNDLLNIETALELQSVEIYNIQGQKVLSSNQKQINVSNLAAGMYMVRIQDTDNNIATKKIVIK